MLVFLGCSCTTSSTVTGTMFMALTVAHLGQAQGLSLSTVNMKLRCSCCAIPHAAACSCSQRNVTSRLLSMHSELQAECHDDNNLQAVVCFLQCNRGLNLANPARLLNMPLQKFASEATVLLKTPLGTCQGCSNAHRAYGIYMYALHISWQDNQTSYT